MTASKHVLAPDFSDGVDRKQLKLVRDRFMQVNQERLIKTHEGLSARQRDILHILPLLFQVNHPLLPGYVGQDCPRGVSAYLPDKTTLTIARGFSQTFKFRADKRHQAEIYSLFIMGSTGTLAHSESSDVDMWCCHDPALDTAAIKRLHAKAQAIDEWANAAGLELHTFLMNAAEFREGSDAKGVDAESSGSAQHYLLLDEFYRTAILLAGRYPLWWLVPPQLEAVYEETTALLLDKRFIAEKEVIDFGSAANIPQNELLGAALWQLYKGLDAPYKSVLKLLLTEVYAVELPAASTLSMGFKQAVYADELNVEALDPYLQVYQRLAAYLETRQQVDRLDLVRKSFYLKVNKALSRPPAQDRASWQRRCLEAITADWGWAPQKYRYLDNRKQWKIDQVMQERKEVFTELSHCYRFLSAFAREQKIASCITAEDLSLLGRKLYAIFQQKAGKVERVNTGIAPDLWEENLAIHHASTSMVHAGSSGWLLYRDLTSAAEAAYHPTLRKSASLMELLAWLYFNGMLTRTTRLSLVPGESAATLHELQSMVNVLSQMIPLPLPAVPQRCFQRAPHPRVILLFINVAQEQDEVGASGDLHRITDQTDVLAYGNQRHNLVRSIDQLTFNSWQELSVQRFDKGESLLQTLQAYLQLCAKRPEARTHQLGVHCFSRYRAEALAARVRHLFADARRAFFGSNGLRLRRFVIAIGGHFYIFSCRDGAFRFKAYRDEAALFDSLAQAERRFSAIAFDRHTLPHESRLRAALEQNRQNTIQVFCYREGQRVEVIVLDETGGLLRFSTAHGDESAVMQSLHAILQSMLERRQLSAVMEDAHTTVPGLVFHRMLQSGERWTIETLVTLPNRVVHQVTAMAYEDDGKLRYDLHCDDLTFSFYDYGERQCAALAHKLAQMYPERQRALQMSDVVFPEHALADGESGLRAYGTLDHVRAFIYFDQQLRSGND